VQPQYWCGESCFKRFLKKKKKKNLSNKNKLTAFFSKLLESCFGIVFKHNIVEREEAEKKSETYKNSQRYKFLQDSIESVENNLEVGIEIDKLHKIYSRANNHALKGLCVKFYKNEISAFLGHNGAGKSTTMHLLTGLYTPTSGTAKINGKLFKY